MQSDENVQAQQLKTALQRKLFDVQKYMAFVEILKTGSHKAQLEQLQDETLPKIRQQRRTFLREQLKKDSAFNKLNKTTLNTIIDFATLIPKEINIEQDNFASEPEIKKWLDSCAIEKLTLLNDNLIKLEKKQKISKRWDKVTDAFYFAAQAVTPLTHIPVLQIVAIPIMNGLWGGWYASSAISIGYDPALGGKIEPVKSIFNKASYLSGGIATAATIAGLIPPFLLLPICAPIAAIGLLTSNVLWTAGAMIDFYKEVKNGKSGPGRNWQIAGKASTVLYTVGSIVIAALAITALFTPVGWAAGAAAVTFGIGAATASLGVFAISKFCQWRADVAEKRGNAARIQMQESSEFGGELTALHTPKPLAKQATKARVDANATTKTTATQKSKKLPVLHLFRLKKKQKTATSFPRSASSAPSTLDATTQSPTSKSAEPKF